MLSLLNTVGGSTENVSSLTMKGDSGVQHMLTTVEVDTLLGTTGGFVKTLVQVGFLLS